MEYFNQSKQNQRNIERLVAIFYSVFCVNICVCVIEKGWDAWIPAYIGLTVVTTWIIYITKYRNYYVRTAITTLMIQLTVILFAANIDNLYEIIPIFMALTVLVGFYSSTKLLLMTFASLLFVLFYHSVITDTFRNASSETMFHLALQVGNIICLEIIVYFWIKKRNRDNEEVYKIIDALMEAERSKDDFLANVSHEIRTPVNTICGMSEMALREYDLDKLREEVFDIRDAGHNLMSLVSDILDFSQLQQGKMELEEEAYNITSTINDIINTAMARKNDKQIELIVDCDVNIPHILFGDEKKIRRIIMNLVDNAIKYTNEGGVIISVHCRRETYGINLCITVKDTGIGMSEQSMEKLFESFSQVDTRRNRQEGGVGLGLAISRALVLKMGGTISARSHLDRGSVFRVVIPQKVIEDKPIGQLSDREKINAAAYFDMEQFDMMTIRDEYTNLIVHIVQQLKVKCHICRNLAELKRRETKDPFTHIFISLEEYQEDESYFDRLAEQIKVILVIDRYREKELSNRNLIRLYKPFYVLPVVSILNGSSGSGGGKQLVRPGKFIAPDAHILIVDDNRMNIRVVEGLLKEYQIRVTYATSGQEALGVIENMCYDFVFMDHMMPEMDGIEAMHRIRNKVGQYYQKVPIIALTANAAPGNREMFLEEGFNDFVAKPIEVSVLERVLKRNLPEEKVIAVKTGQMAEMPKVSDVSDMFDVPEISDVPEVSDVSDGEGAEGDSSFDVGDLDVQQGMIYCGGKEQYLEILAECFEQEKEYRPELENLYETGDWENYTIRVHGLKSTMRSIGANGLFEKAKALEAAGKRRDIDYIRSHHEEMLAEYRRVMEIFAESPFVRTDTSRGPGDVSDVSGGKSLPEEDLSDMPELDEDGFDRLQGRLEDAVYSFDSSQMLAVLSEMQEYRYCNLPLREKLVPVLKKIEKSDYMSAVDAVSSIRDKLRNGQEGGTADA